MLGLVGLEFRGPIGLVRGTLLLGIPTGIDTGRHFECVMIPTDGGFGQINFILAQWRTVTILAILMLVCGNGAVTWSEQRAPSGLVALIVTSVPLWIVLLDWIRPGERPESPVPPWDHLRDNRYPVNTHLNRLRLDEYRGKHNVLLVFFPWAWTPV